MSLISEFTRIKKAGKRQYENAKGKPLSLIEEITWGQKPFDAQDDAENMVIHGDNKEVMKTLLSEYDMAGKVKMIYIDPPFFSKAEYDAVVKAGGENIRHLAYADKWEKGLSSYLKMLTARLYLMRDLLAEEGLIWVHLDWHAAHYVKVFMDEIFGEKNFVNEIIWTYKSGGSSKRHFSRKHDTILVYSKNAKYDFFPQQEKSYNRQLKPYHFRGVKEYKDEVGWYTLVGMKDVWNIDMVGRTSSERTGYATQKPEQLLLRMMESCTKEGDLCADFFCGSGTLAAVAASRNRRFIACDAGELAVESTIGRLAKGNTSFRVFEAGKRDGGSRLNVKVGLEVEPFPASDKVLLRVRLLSLSERGLEKSVDEKMRETVRRIAREKPLDMVSSWSVDFEFNDADGIHRPDLVLTRTKGDLPDFCEKIADGPCRIRVKVVDIFGNSTYERMEYEG